MVYKCLVISVEELLSHFMSVIVMDMKMSTTSLCTKPIERTLQNSPIYMNYHYKILEEFICLILIAVNLFQKMKSKNLYGKDVIEVLQRSTTGSPVSSCVCHCRKCLWPQETVRRMEHLMMMNRLRVMVVIQKIH